MIEKNIVIMNFSHIYDQEKFYQGESYLWIDIADLSGCNCYCDDEAKDTIHERIKNSSVKGIHFIDSGNYHYMSKIWLEKIERPFRLLVFDNHTDMQPPVFGGILSCGGWIAASLEENIYLQNVFLVGPDEKAYEQVGQEIKDKTNYLSREVLGANKRRHLQRNPIEDISAANVKNYGIQETDMDSVIDFFKRIPTDLPLYISIDKDVLSVKDAFTTWSQGDMRLQELCDYIRIVLQRFKEAGQEIIGIDICGECDLDQAADNEKNDIANKVLLELLITECGDTSRRVYYEK